MSRKLFPVNEHYLDRLLRIVLGIALLLMVVVGPHTLWGLVGIVPLFTGLAGSCPLYTLLGIDTCALGSKRRPQT